MRAVAYSESARNGSLADIFQVVPAALKCGSSPPSSEGAGPNSASVRWKSVSTNWVWSRGLAGAEACSAAERGQQVARSLGLSETIVVDDAGRGAIRIFTPEPELGFAGHPTVGTAWLLREVGVAVVRTTCGQPPDGHSRPAGPVRAWLSARVL
jgi:hypothetical protein